MGIYMVLMAVLHAEGDMSWRLLKFEMSHKTAAR